MPLRAAHRLALAALLFVGPPCSAQTAPNSALGWSVDPAKNATIDPAIPAQDGASTRSYMGTVRGVMSGVSQALGTMNAPPIGRVARSFADRFGDLPLTPQDKGAACNGTADDTAALNGLVGFLSEITIASGTCRVAADSAWPKGRTIRIAAGAGITVDAGKTLNIRGRVEAPLRRVFFGAGAVVGLTLNRPEWWGANTQYLNTVDSKPAIQAALNSARASYSGATPFDVPDGGRPVVELGTGFYRICSPLDAYPDDATPIVIHGRSALNSGSSIEACDTFTGGAMLNIHGIASGKNTSWEIDLRNFSLFDRNRRSTACIRFVPEGAGYSLNSGSIRPSIIENVLAGVCPIGLDIVNTVQMRVNRFHYTSTSTSNNTGVSLATAGSGSTANTGSLVFEDLQTLPCPTHNAATCTNTTAVQMRTDGANDGTNNHQITAITFTGNTVFWAANFGIDARASNGGIIGDHWISAGTQFDGVGCSYVKYLSDGVNSQVFNIHIDHVYHTTIANTSCAPHQFDGPNGGKLDLIWETNNEFVLGPAAASAIFIGAATNVVVSGNVVKGAGAAMAPVYLGAVARASVTGNIFDVIGGATAWSNGVKIEGSDFINASGNICSATTAACVTVVSPGTRVSATGNVGP